MKEALVAFSNREEHMQSDSTFVVLMSHGLRDKICGSLHSKSKEDLFHIDKVFDILNNKNCKGLREKPKVVIIQACRGSEYSSKNCSCHVLRYINRYINLFTVPWLHITIH